MALKMTPLACFLLVFLLARNDVVDGTIGMNWGRQSAQRLIPSMVVDLLLQNGIQEARIFTSEEDILRAFADSGISLSLTLRNIKEIDTYQKSSIWIGKRIKYFIRCKIRRIYIGDQVFITGLTDKSYIDDALQTLHCLQTALNDAGYGDQIKVMFSHHCLILKDNITKPSEAEFHDEIKDEMVETLQFHRQINAPFAIDMFPIGDIGFNLNFEPTFAFPDNKSKTVVRDVNGAVYTNIFEFVIDSFIWSMRKMNVTDMDILVSQVGWPTDGHAGANAKAAEYFFKHLLPFVTSNRGTPMRPGRPINTYVHALTDETRMNYIHPFSRHWGIYRSNGQPKYKIDLSGQGRDIYPATAKGIMRMPERWCMFNGNRTNIETVVREVNYACQQSDCTSLAPGGSCSHLSYELNISYAFNMHFQFQYQDEKACHFSGLGYVSVDNPSTKECVFPVEVVKGQQNNYVAMTAGTGFHVTTPNRAIFVFLLSILGILFWN